MARRFATRLKECGDRKLLSLFYTAGFPTLEDTLPLAIELEKAGADCIEIGIPYSDPLADGPVIQRSSDRAIKNGMTISLLLKQLSSLRTNVSLPVYLMGYLNPVLQYGMEPFLDRCAEIGIDGLIIPDLPYREYQAQYHSLFLERALSMIFLVTPYTETERLRAFDAMNQDFIYAVSTPSITGGALSVGAREEQYYQSLQDAALSTPLMVGFGISDRASFQQSTKHFSGGIIGSAFILALEQEESITRATKQFISSVQEQRS